MVPVAGPGAVEAFDRAWESGARAMRLVGLPGSGRSTTAAELARRVAARGCATALGEPAPSGVPFGPWLAVARALGPRAADAFAQLGDHDARCRALLAECAAAPAVDPERLDARLGEALASLGGEPTPLRARVMAARASLAAPAAGPRRPPREPPR